MKKTAYFAVGSKTFSAGMSKLGLNLLVEDDSIEYFGPVESPQHVGVNQVVLIEFEAEYRADSSGDLKFVRATDMKFLSVSEREDFGCLEDCTTMQLEHDYVREPAPIRLQQYLEVPATHLSKETFGKYQSGAAKYCRHFLTSYETGFICFVGGDLVENFEIAPDMKSAMNLARKIGAKLVRFDYCFSENLEELEIFSHHP